MLRTLSRVIAALAITALPLSLSAQRAGRPASLPAAIDTPPLTRDALQAPGKDVTISLLTMGTGNEVWSLFGHDALLIHDNATGRDTVFNWGVFNFRQPNFLSRFLKGRMLYAMGGDSLDLLMYAYRYWNRSVVSQELDLTASQRDTVLSLIRLNAQPENINYRYDYFRDNCTTRVRDILDRALGGQLRAQSQKPSGTTYRSQALRLMQVDLPIALGVDLGLGRTADRELTMWQVMFLPRQLHDFVATLKVRDDSTGTMRPLVKGERVLYPGTRPPEPDATPSYGGWLLGAGIVFAGLFYVLGTRAIGGGRVARVSAAVVVGIWTIAAGLLGTVVTALWTITDHVFAHSNENVLLFNPLWLVLGVAMIASLARGRIGPWSRRLAFAMSVMAALALVLHGVGFSQQQNLPIIGLVLPPALVLASLGKFARQREH